MRLDPARLGLWRFLRGWRGRLFLSLIGSPFSAFGHAIFTLQEAALASCVDGSSLRRAAGWLAAPCGRVTCRLEYSRAHEVFDAPTSLPFRRVVNTMVKLGVVR